ncbi:MAG TPA: ferritin family protein [Steroidobacteraceae bacterium]|nr:ferritin family protein [Steroidobacteraceae bacterium]
MSGSTNPPVTSIAALYGIAHRLETDAAERYALLADQMQTHNNLELARLFEDLARAERLHADEIRRLAGPVGVGAGAGPIGPWKSESPESADLYAADYAMSPHHALQMALAAEERALAFYTELAASKVEPAVRRLAETFAAEEREHVALCHRLLARHSPAPADRPGDPDAPAAR